ncbi:MAG: hypothetical protein ACYC7D_04415 [Nitrososphaerales archaeon]
MTGNPFVDTGLAVIAARSSLDSINELNLGHIRNVHDDGEWLAKETQKLKSFTMIFTRNSLLTQFPKNDPKHIREKRIRMQASITRKFLDSIGAESKDEYCQCCGNEKSLYLSDLVNDALEKFGEKPKARFIGRDWFPLAGSMGSDAQALPSASQAPNLCAKCLLAVQYLPLGVRLFGNDLAVFQSTSIDFWFQVVRDLSIRITKQCSQGISEIVGSKQGRAGLVIQLLEIFKDLQQTERNSTNESDTNLFVWRFANSTSPNIEIDQIPSFALSFLRRASREHGLGQEITNILKRDRVPDGISFFGSLVSKRDYYGLYPGKLGKEKDYRGASHDLFYIYQTEIIRRRPESLKAAYEIARIAINEFKSREDSVTSIQSKKNRSQIKHVLDKELERLTRREAFKDRATKSKFRKIMATQARAGNFSYREYLDLFPHSGNTVSVSQSGWDLLRYYVGAAARGEELEFNYKDSLHDFGSEQSNQLSDKVISLALIIFQSYLQTQGIEKFGKHVFAQLEKNRLDINWLRIQFVKLAREHNSFEYKDWVTLCRPNQSKWWTISELYFQVRLLWSQWLRTPPIPVKEKSQIEESLTEIIHSSLLPDKIATRLSEVFNQYIAERGLDRFERDILLRLQRAEIGFGWFAAKLTVDYPNSDRINEEEFNGFLLGPSGRFETSERLFQMSLFLNNAYRLAKTQPNALIAKVIL